MQFVGSNEKDRHGQQGRMEGKGETGSGRRTEGKGKMEEKLNQSLFLH